MSNMPGAAPSAGKPPSAVRAKKPEGQSALAELEKRTAPLEAELASAHRTISELKEQIGRLQDIHPLTGAASAALGYDAHGIATHAHNMVGRLFDVSNHRVVEEFTSAARESVRRHFPELRQSAARRFIDGTALGGRCIIQSVPLGQVHQVEMVLTALDIMETIVHDQAGGL